MSARVLAVCAAVALAGAALAHRAPAGWEYDPECCSARDCAQVRPGAIREVAGGYSVVIEPGTHMMVPAGSPRFEAFVPFGDPRIRPSGDEHRHACLSAWRHLYCIYVPAGSV